MDTKKIISRPGIAASKAFGAVSSLGVSPSSDLRPHLEFNKNNKRERN